MAKQGRGYRESDGKNILSTSSRRCSRRVRTTMTQMMTRRGQRNNELVKRDVADVEEDGVTEEDYDGKENICEVEYEAEDDTDEEDSCISE